VIFVLILAMDVPIATNRESGFMQGKVKWLVSDPIETNRVWGTAKDYIRITKFQTLSKPIGYGGIWEH
jgi:hypothetical protein